MKLKNGIWTESRGDEGEKMGSGKNRSWRSLHRKLCHRCFLLHSRSLPFTTETCLLLSFATATVLCSVYFIVVLACLRDVALRPRNSPHWDPNAARRNEVTRSVLLRASSNTTLIVVSKSLHVEEPNAVEIGAVGVVDSLSHPNALRCLASSSRRNSPR